MGVRLGRSGVTELGIDVVELSVAAIDQFASRGAGY